MGASIELVGFTAALFSAIPMLFSVPFGRWVDRRGTHTPLIFSAILIGLAAATTIVFASKYTLLFTAALVGTGAIFTHIVATRAVGEIGPREQRGRNLGLLVMIYSITQFLGPTVSGSVYEHFGRTAALATIGFLGILMIAGLSVGQHNYRSRADDLARGQKKLRIAELMTMPVLRKWLIISGTFMSVITTLPFTVALHAAEVGISATSAGLVLGAFSGGMFAARAVVPLAGRRVKPVRLVHISLLLGGCAYALMPFAGQLATLAASGAIIGLTLGMGGPLTLGLIYEAAPNERVNEAVGLSLAMASFLQTLLPLLMGLIAAWVGMAPVVLGLAAGLVAASIYVLKPRGS
jgi:MFS family permease